MQRWQNGARGIVGDVRRPLFWFAVIAQNIHGIKLYSRMAFWTAKPAKVSSRKNLSTYGILCTGVSLYVEAVTDGNRWCEVCALAVYCQTVYFEGPYTYVLARLPPTDRTGTAQNPCIYSRLPCTVCHEIISGIGKLDWLICCSLCALYIVVGVSCGCVFVCWTCAHIFHYALLYVVLCCTTCVCVLCMSVFMHMWDILYSRTFEEFSSIIILKNFLKILPLAHTKFVQNSILQLKVSHSPIRTMAVLDKMIKALGGCPRNDLDKKRMVTVTLLLSSN